MTTKLWCSICHKELKVETKDILGKHIKPCKTCLADQKEKMEFDSWEDYCNGCDICWDCEYHPDNK